jgi:poly(3-hydroxybutyrate) depolymerase
MQRGRPLQHKRVVRRVLQADPAQEYFVYVPGGGGDGARLFVAVHGISRNALEQAKLFAGFAETLNVVLVAPLFPAARYSDYQRLGRQGRGTRADVVLDSIVDEVCWQAEIATTRIHLFGYSGGAQFAHRYTMAYPHRVAAAYVAAAGWYTFPTRHKRYPYGILPSRELADLRFDPEEFLRVPITVAVGAEDTTQEELRRTKRVVRQQGVTRVDRAHRWVKAMQAAADRYRLESRVSLQVIAGGGHSFEDLMQNWQMGERVFDALFSVPATGEADHASDIEARSAYGGNGNREGTHGKR